MLPKGVHTVRKANGSVYRYAWRGGPRLYADPKSDDFLIEHGAALQSRKSNNGLTLWDFVGQYLESKRFDSLTDKGKRNRARDCDRIRLDTIKMENGKVAPLHALTRGALEDSAVRSIFIKWRDSYSDRPRAADMNIETLSVVLTHAMDEGRLDVNRALRISKIYKNNRSDVVWEDVEIEAVCAAGTPAIAAAIRFAALTGLRQGDCAEITWAADKGNHLDWETSKTGKRVLVPILPELRELLDGLPRHGETILTNSNRGKWTGQAIGNAFQRAKNKTGIEGKRFHDLRGTFATLLVRAGVTDERTADIIGWSKDRVSEIRRVYVDKDAILADVLRQIAVNSPVNRKQDDI